MERGGKTFRVESGSMERGKVYRRCQRCRVRLRVARFQLRVSTPTVEMSIPHVSTSLGRFSENFASWVLTRCHIRVLNFDRRSIEAFSRTSLVPVPFSATLLPSVALSCLTRPLCTMQPGGSAVGSEPFASLNFLASHQPTAGNPCSPNWMNTKGDVPEPWDEARYDSEACGWSSS